MTFYYTLTFTIFYTLEYLSQADISVIDIRFFWHIWKYVTVRNLTAMRATPSGIHLAVKVNSFCFRGGGGGNKFILLNIRKCVSACTIENVMKNIFHMFLYWSNWLILLYFNIKRCDNNYSENKYNVVQLLYSHLFPRSHKDMWTVSDYQLFVTMHKYV